MPYNHELPPETPTFIYALRDPRDGAIKYIGKADDPKQRLAAHCVVSDRELGRERVIWLVELRDLGMKPIMEVLEETTLGEHRRRETYWIYHFSRKGERLTNSHGHLNAKPVYVGIFKDQADAIKAMADDELNFSTLVRVLLDYALDNHPDNLRDYAMRILEERAKGYQAA